MLIAIGKILLKLNPIRENIAHAVINDRWQYKNLTESFLKHRGFFLLLKQKRFFIFFTFS